MGMLAGFVGGAAQGMLDYGQRNTDRLKEEAKEAMHMRLAQFGHELDMEAAEQTAELTLTKGKELAEFEHGLKPPEMTWEQKQAIEQANKIALEKYKADLKASGKDGSDGKDGKYNKDDFMKLSIGEGMDVEFDKKNGTYLDPLGYMTQPRISTEEAQRIGSERYDKINITNGSDKEIAEHYSKLGMGHIKTEEDAIRYETQKALRESSFASQNKIPSSKILRSYGQQEVPEGFTTVGNGLLLPPPSANQNAEAPQAETPSAGKEAPADKPAAPEPAAEEAPASRGRVTAADKANPKRVDLGAELSSAMTSVEDTALLTKVEKALTSGKAIGRSAQQNKMTDKEIRAALATLSAANLSSKDKARLENLINRVAN